MGILAVGGKKGARVWTKNSGFGLGFSVGSKPTRKSSKPKARKPRKSKSWW